MNCLRRWGSFWVVPSPPQPDAAQSCSFPTWSLETLPMSRQIAPYSIRSQGHLMAHLALGIVLIKDQWIPHFLPRFLQGYRGCHKCVQGMVDAMDGLQKPRSAERLSQGFRRSAGKGRVSERPETFRRYQLLSSSPSLADKAAVQLHVAGGCSWPTCPALKSCSLDKGPSSQSWIQRAIQLKPLLPILRCIIFPKDKMHLYSSFQTCIFCLHLLPFARAWDRWLSTAMFGLEQFCG